MSIFLWPRDLFRTRSSRFYIAPHSRSFESPLNRASLHDRLGGERWVAELETVTMDEPTWRQLAAFLSRLDGPTGKVLLGPYLTGGYTGARGVGIYDPTGASVPFSDDAPFSDDSTFAEGAGAGQLAVIATRGDSSIAIAGMTASVTAVEPGDLLQLGDPYDAGCQLLEVVARANSNASGTARVEVRPRLRIDYPAGTPVTFVDPRGIFRLADDGQTGIDRTVITASHALRFVEVV